MKPKSKSLLTLLLALIVCQVYSQSAGPDQLTCLGTTVTMAATGSGTWTALPNNPTTTWFGSAHISNPSSPTTTINNFPIWGTYGFVWNTTPPDTMYVNVLNSDTVDIAALHNQTCAGGRDTFELNWYNNSGHGQYTFQWYLNGTAVAGATDSIWAVSNLHAGDQVSCHTISNPACTNNPPYFRTITITGLTRVSLSAQGLCAGHDTLIATGVIYYLSDSLQWWTAAGQLVHTSLAADSTYVPSVAGSYTVILKSPQGCQSGYSDTIVVSACFSAGPDQSICGGDTVTLAGTGTGTWTVSPNNYSAVHFGNANQGNTYATGFDSTAVYTLIYTQGGVSDTVLISVSRVATPSLQIYSPSTVFCPGNHADTFRINYTGYTGSAPRYQWYLNNIPVASNSLTYSYAPVADHDTISAMMISNYQCATRDSVFSNMISIRIQDTPIAPVLATYGSFCAGGDTIRVDGTGSLHLSWYLNGSLDTITSTVVQQIGVGQISHPQSVAQDASGNIYVTTRTFVAKYPPNSDSTTIGAVVAGGNGNGGNANQLWYPMGMCVDAAGNLYVADANNYRVQKFPAGSTSSTSGVTVAGGNGYGSATNQLGSPWGLAVDNAGNLFVADNGNQRILKFPAGSTAATSGLVVANVYSPKGMCMDAAGNLYVANYSAGQVLKFPPGFTSATVPTVVAARGLDYPSDVSVDAAGNIYESGNSSVKKFPANSNDTTPGIIVAGSTVLGSGMEQLQYTNGVKVDASGNLYIVDYNNNRFMKYATNFAITPDAPGVYTAQYADLMTGCPSAMSDTVTVAPCLSDSVWPGDADHNGVADNNDLLPLGIGYGLNGFSRPDQSIVWSAHYAQDWGLQFLSGTNAKHADCNGDAVINGDDTTAILTNFGLTHSKTDAAAAYRSGVPAIRLQYSKDTVQQGDTLTVSLLIGDSALPVNNLYGLAFTYHYDALVVDTTTTAFDFVNSFLATSVNGMSIRREFKSQGIVKAAVTGINHLNRSGYGKVAQFIATITTGNINGKDLSYYSNINYISDIYAIDKDGDSVALSFVLDSDQVAYEPSGIREVDDTRIRLYPNPAHDMVTIETEEPMLNEAYTLYDVTGRVVAGGRIHGRTTQLVLSDLAPGIYTLQLRDQRAVYKIIKN